MVSFTIQVSVPALSREGLAPLDQISSLGTVGAFSLRDNELAQKDGLAAAGALLLYGTVVSNGV